MTNYFDYLDELDRENLFEDVFILEDDDLYFILNEEEIEELEETMTS